MNLFQEEQNASSSANYDVEIIHSAEAHAGLRAAQTAQEATESVNFIYKRKLLKVLYFFKFYAFFRSIHRNPKERWESSENTPFPVFRLSKYLN